MPEHALRPREATRGRIIALLAGLAVLVAVALLAAGCGGGSDPPAATHAAAKVTPAVARPRASVTRRSVTRRRAGAVTTSAAPSRRSSRPATVTRGSSRSAAPSSFAAHAGLAFGVFHKWIYTPEKAAELNPKTHAAIITRAIAAASLVLSQTTLARQAATGHSSLAKTLAPLAAIERTITVIRTNLATHNANLASLTAAAIQYTNEKIQAVETIAKAAHQPISETTTGARI